MSLEKTRFVLKMKPRLQAELIEVVEVVGKIEREWLLIVTDKHKFSFRWVDRQKVPSWQSIVALLVWLY